MTVSPTAAFTPRSSDGGALPSASMPDCKHPNPKVAQHAAIGIAIRTAAIRCSRTAVKGGEKALNGR